MIKKPKSPTLADALRGQEVVDRMHQAVREYKEKVFNGVAKDFDTNNAYELVIRLAEKYHEPYKQNQTQGRKPKWTPKIEVMLAVFIELRLEEANPKSIDEDILEILTWEPWKQFLTKGNKKEVLGLETFRTHYDAGKKSDLFMYEMESYRSDPGAWMRKLIVTLAG